MKIQFSSFKSYEIQVNILTNILTGRVLHARKGIPTDRKIRN